MTTRKRLLLFLVLPLLVTISLSCRVYFETPTPIPDTPTPTPIRPTTTPTTYVWTPTPTYWVPTDTPTPIPPTATPTPASPRALLEGTWVAEMNGDGLVYFIFNDGVITIRMDDELFLEGSYRADFSYEPAHVDLLFEEEEDVFLIVEFIGANTMRMDGGDSPGEHPISFSQDTIKFVRVREE